MRLSRFGRQFLLERASKVLNKFQQYKTGKEMAKRIENVEVKILDFVKAYVEKHGEGPMQREIGAGVGMTQSAAGYQIRRLAGLGKLVHHPRTKRGIELAKAA